MTRQEAIRRLLDVLFKVGTLPEDAANITHALGITVDEAIEATSARPA